MSELSNAIEALIKQAIADAVVSKGSPSGVATWRNKAHRVPDTFSLTWLGKSKEEATAQAIAENRYILDWRLECSTDGGKTWHTQPDIRDIPRVE